MTLPEWFPTWPPAWLQPWHLSLVIAALCLLAFLYARARFERARDEWADAFFYSPSNKAQARLRRKQWQDRCWAALTLTIAFVLAAGILYVRGPG